MDSYIVEGWEFQPVQASDLERVVRELAEEQPDFVYEQPAGADTCQYTHADGSPGCIVGAGLAKLGQQIPYDHGWNTAMGVAGLGVEGVVIGNTEWLEKVQEYQDVRISWGKSVRYADEYTAKLEEEASQRDDSDL